MGPSGSSLPSIKKITATLSLSLSLGSHRDQIFIRNLNRILSGAKDDLPDLATLQKDLKYYLGRSSVSSLRDITQSEQARRGILKLVAANTDLRRLLRGQSSNNLILEIFKAGKRDAPSFATPFSTNVFGEVSSITVTPLIEGSYDFCVRKTFGLRQCLEGTTLAESMTLAFPKPIRVGDLNSDGFINVLDFQIFLKSLGAVTYDFNEDGRTDLYDVVEFLKGWEGQ